MKKNKIKLTVLLFIFLSSTIVIGQNYKPIKDVDDLKEHESVLKEVQPKVFKQLKIESIYKVNEDHTAIGFFKGNTYSEVVVNHEKEEMLLVLSSVEVDPDKAPKIIKDVWEEKYSQEWKLDKILYSKTPYGDDYYTLVLYKVVDDGEKMWNRVFYNELGQKQPPIF